MREIILDGSRMVTREGLHDYLAEKFCFPDYYGRNMDALWDLLTSESEDMLIIMTNMEQMLLNLGEYGEQVLALFECWERESSNVKLLKS